MFENGLANGVHYSRYIMSWVRMGGSCSKRAGYSMFEDWLKSSNLEPEDIENITHMAQNGRMELETSAARFLKQEDSKN